MGAKKHELIPSARRLIMSLRDMGYDFASAVADVVDNSIEAHATKIDIDVHSAGEQSWVRIADNGVGMKPVQIREALRYGAAREYDERTALGKFGLGLKTASMSQCQHLIVASRCSADRVEVAAHAWDLEHVMKTDSWEILAVGRNEYPELIREPLQDHTGTVVLWRRLDRLLGYKHPYGEMMKKRLLSMCSELEGHLAMVFHRYLAGEAGRRRVRISVNGTPVRPWDPFVRHEEATQKLEPVTLHYDHEGVRGEILVEPFVLPHQESFSSPQAHAAAAGPLRWNRQQGFYIYRANRMIQSGGWSNLRTMDEHTKLARVALGFDPRLDDAFRINVAKMRVQLPRQLREQIEKAIAPVIKAAQVTYRRPGSGVPICADANLQSRSAQPIGNASTHATITATKVTAIRTSALSKPAPRTDEVRLWTIPELQEEIKRIATAAERSIVLPLLDRLTGTRAVHKDLLVPDDVPVIASRGLKRHSVQ